MAQQTLILEPAIITQTCYNCKETKPIIEFRKRKSRKSGYGTLCKSCQRLQSLEYTRRNYEKEKARWTAKNLKRRDDELFQKLRLKRAKERYREMHPEIKSPRWTDEEKNIIKENYTTKTRDEILKLLSGRAWAQILYQGRELGFKRENDNTILQRRGQRKCKICHEVKPLQEFYSKGYRCNPCHYKIYNLPENIEKRKKKGLHTRINGDAFKNAYQNVKGTQGHGGRKSMSQDFTREYVLELAEQQDYKCAITGLPLNRKRGWMPHHPLKPSLDRIDNTKGYTPGNVRWVSLWANMAHGQWSDEILYELCKITIEHKNKITS